MYHIKMLLWDFNAKMVKNDRLELSNDKGFWLIHSAVSKYLIVKSIKFPRHSIHKHTWILLMRRHKTLCIDK
jgi:hypothetical protein